MSKMLQGFLIGEKRTHYQPMGAEHRWEITGTTPRSLLSKVTQLFLLSFFILFQNTSVTSHCVIHVLNKRWLSTITSRSPITTSSVHRLKNTNFCYLHASFLFILKPFFFFFWKGAECYIATADLSGYFSILGISTYYIHGLTLTDLSVWSRGG